MEQQDFDHRSHGDHYYSSDLCRLVSEIHVGPYGNLDQLPVAVVNNDKSVEYDGKTLSVGSDMVDELKDNDALDFHFVDSEEAEQGLKNGTYYMVITIPEDFSKDASTLMDDNPKKMELKYETNPGTNYIASKMSEERSVQDP